ncbi:MFS transporter [Pontibacter sp. 172403-2]|uniref:MFS transporter n=1 Tax=Pontibacter rufus TaxID=2791028 RepID=UPI0018AF8FC4|nr:MFS transporter [Pontibacter sp. 172403-2]MBF9253417.1 MFS transporter [Pontibacter sp. 172403-2]
MFRALSHKNYRLFFMGQGVSLVGTWMERIAMSWLVYRLTDSVFLLGMVSFCSLAPSFILGPFAGVISDRFDRHRILVVTQASFMLQAAAVAALVLTDTIRIWHILALSTFMGIVNAFDTSTRQAFVIELVEDRDDLSNAIALNSSLFNVARLVGPSIAGVIIAAVGEGACFLINALSYMAVIGSLLLMRTKPFVPVKQHRKVWQQLQDGFRYTFRFPPIRAIILVVASMSLIGMPFSVLMPAFARDILGGNANTLGFLMGASGIGALTGALYLAPRKSAVGLGKVIVAAAVIFGLGLIAFSFSTILWVSLLCMLFVGFGMIVQMASCNTILQTIVEDDKRGRVMSFYSMASLGMGPFGSLLAGAIAERIGVGYTLLGCGILIMLTIVPFALQLSRLREMVRPIYQRLGILPEIASGLQAANNLTVPGKEGSP